MTARGKPRADRPVDDVGRADQLGVLGLGAGDRVRWRAGTNGRWRYGIVKGRERDGSIAVTADGGAARSLEVDRLHVSTRGRRGAAGWEPVTVRASRAEQLSLGFV